jgi:hypothetical protein
LRGGKENSSSILEAFALAEEISGRDQSYVMLEANRIGDTFATIVTCERSERTTLTGRSASLCGASLKRSLKDGSDASRLRHSQFDGPDRSGDGDFLRPKVRMIAGDSSARATVAVALYPEEDDE